LVAGKAEDDLVEDIFEGGDEEKKEELGGGDEIIQNEGKINRTQQIDTQMFASVSASEV